MLLCFAQALAALGHPPESRETLEQAIDLRLAMRNVFIPLGEFGRLREWLPTGVLNLKITKVLGLTIPPSLL